MRRRAKSPASFPRQPLVVLFDRNAAVCGGNLQGRAELLATDPALVAHVRAFVKGSLERSSFRTADDREIRLVRLRHAGDLRVVAEIHASQGLSPAERLLTRAQREIARRAAAGATLNEIAKAIDRSPETVRAHLREVYRRLDVSTRIELMQALTATT